MQNPLVVGARIYLRPQEPDDAEVWARFDATETETFMYRGRAPYSPLDYAHEITEIHKHAPPEHIEVAVCLTADDRLIGSVGLYTIDWVNRTAETGSYLGDPAARGQGYGTEAKHLLLQYAFDTLHLQVIMSTVFETNTRSVAALMKQGYRPAGRWRRFDVKGGIYRDMLLFDLLRDEWLAARGT